VPGTKEFNSEEVEAQTDQALKNMGEILKAGGCTFDDVVKTTVLLADIKDFAAVNGVYSKYFSSDPPARSAFAVRELPLGAKVEIECIASCN
jgi:reactive intermediate/imine deaminase